MPVSYTHLDVYKRQELGNAQDELRAFIEKADMPCGCTLLGLSACLLYTSF